MIDVAIAARRTDWLVSLNVAELAQAISVGTAQLCTYGWALAVGGDASAVDLATDGSLGNHVSVT
jgi:hypothetical protein